MIINKLNNIGSIKESINTSLSKFEDIDLHLQHLLLEPKFDQYQSKVDSIESNCKTLVEEISKLTITSNTSTNSQVLSDNDFSEIINRIKSSSDSVNDLSAKFDQLQSSVDGFVIPSTLGKSPSSNHHLEAPTTSMPLLPTTNPTNAYDKYVREFISTDMDLSTELTNFLTSESAKFTDKNGGGAAAYGEPYHYTGSKTPKPTAIPGPIMKLIAEIEKDYPDHCINSCVVNRYTGPESFLVEHQDNEKSIRARSNIFSISLGSMATLKFRDCCSSEEMSLPVEGNSLYVMSQASQHYWTHRIDPDTERDSDFVRYSITLRSVHKANRNSTIILGDSNTRFLEPTDRKVFGTDMPGRRELTFQIRDIDPELCVGYQNIIVHVGINDLNEYSKGRVSTDPSPDDVESHFSLFASKLNEIQQLCPYARLIVSPVLPTKLEHINERALMFNKMLFDYSHNHAGIIVLNFNSFLDRKTDMLGNQFTSYKNPRHPIHLGRQGICMLGALFKDAVCRRKVDGRGFNSVVAGRTYASGFPAFARS